MDDEVFDKLWNKFVLPWHRGTESMGPVASIPTALLSSNGSNTGDQLSMYDQLTSFLVAKVVTTCARAVTMCACIMTAPCLRVPAP